MTKFSVPVTPAQWPVLKATFSKAGVPLSGPDTALKAAQFHGVDLSGAYDSKAGALTITIGQKHGLAVLDPDEDIEAKLKKAIAVALLPPAAGSGTHQAIPGGFKTTVA